MIPTQEAIWRRCGERLVSKGCLVGSQALQQVGRQIIVQGSLLQGCGQLAACPQRCAVELLIILVAQNVAVAILRRPSSIRTVIIHRPLQHSMQAFRRPVSIKGHNRVAALRQKTPNPGGCNFPSPPPPPSPPKSVVEPCKILRGQAYC